MKMLPPDPEGLNADRADWAESAMVAFAAITGQDAHPDDFSDVPSDLIANVMHWCDRNDMDFDQVLSRARCHYDEETTE